MKIELEEVKKMTIEQFEIVNKKKNRGFIFLVALACFFSNISQLPFFVSTGMTQKLNMPMWIILLLYIFLKKKIRVFYSTFKIFFAICSVFVLILLSSIVTNNSYFIGITKLNFVVFYLLPRNFCRRPVFR